MIPAPLSTRMLGSPVHRGVASRVIRIVVVDDHPVVRLGLTSLFSLVDDFELVASCDTGEGGVATILDEKPDVAIVDLQMRPVDGVEVLKRVRAAGDTTPVMILAGSMTDEEVVEVMRAGAKGVVLKELTPELLIAAVRKVAAGGTWLEKGAVGRTLERILQHEERRQLARETLTNREIEIVKMVAAGHANREIGARLCITEGTVKSHLHTIYDKLDVRGRVQLSSYVREAGLA